MNSHLKKDFFLGHAQIVQLLLKNGADINIKSNQGLTPLHGAAEFGKFFLAKWWKINVNQWKIVILIT